MVQCWMINELFLKLKKYDIFVEEADTEKFNKFSRKKRISLIFVFLIVFIIFLFILCFYSLIPTIPKPTYDRKNDKNLLKLISESDSSKSLPIIGNLFCWVQTSTKFHETRSLAINETWIHRCDHGQLFTSEHLNDSRIPYSTVFAGIPDDYYNLFFKSRYAFYYIYNFISPNFDWYLKADDDTYVIVENLRTFLSGFNPDEPHYFGYVLKPYLKNGYNAGGAGYVMSRAALKIFSEKLYNDSVACPDDIYEDVGIARCLASAGIYPEDTRNSKGQNRFNTFTPMDTFFQKKANQDWVRYSEKSGYDAFANDLISFHHLSPDEIRLFDILLYRTNVHKN